MHYSLKVISGPAEEPVTLESAGNWIKDLQPEDHNLVAGLIPAARERAELETERALITQTVRMTLDRFPMGCDREPWLDGEIIHLPKAPLLSVVGVEYTGASGVLTAIDASQWQIDADSEPARLAPGYGLCWPTSRCQLGAVRITYTAGYGDAAAVPEGIKTAIKLMVNYWYKNRGDEPQAGMMPGQMAAIPQAASAILLGFWVGNV